MKWLEKKTISKIIASDNEFLCITNNTYDKAYDIKSSYSGEYKVKIFERISPAGNMKIFDVKQIDVDKRGMGKKLVMATAKDSTFYYHRVSPEVNEKAVVTKPNNMTNVTKDNPSKAAMWPYVAFASNENSIWLLCAFNLD